MSARRTLIIATSLVAAALLLTACGPTSTPTATSQPTSKPSASSTSTSTSTSSATPTPTSSPDPVATDHVETGTPVGLSCNDVITPQQIYDFNPNFGIVNGFVPEAGSLAGQAVAASGLACRWMNQTSGDTIDVSVAQLDAKSTSTRKADLAASSTPVSAFGPDGYFDQGDLASAAQAFPGKFWVTATSVAFFGVDDATPIMSAAIGALG